MIGAFRFQLLETAITWLNLSEPERLLIEIFEDFDVVNVSGGAELTQVKHSSGGRSLTLASKDARGALKNFWATSQFGEVPGVSMVIHTNMVIGAETGADLPGGVIGIAYWHAVIDGADVGPLKDLLSKNCRMANLKPGSKAQPMTLRCDQGSLNACPGKPTKWCGKKRFACRTYCRTSCSS